MPWVLEILWHGRNWWHVDIKAIPYWCWPSKQQAISLHNLKITAQINIAKMNYVRTNKSQISRRPCKYCSCLGWDWYPSQGSQFLPCILRSLCLSLLSHIEDQAECGDCLEKYRSEDSGGNSVHPGSKPFRGCSSMTSA